MQPFLCPSCTKILKSLYAPPQIPLTLSHQRPLLLPLQSTGATDGKDFFFIKKKEKREGKVEKFMRHV